MRETMNTLWRAAIWLTAVFALGAGCDTAPSAPNSVPAPGDPPPPAAAALRSPPAVRARLTGDVVDYHGRSLAGATVTARDDAQGVSVSVFTDGNGHYAFPEIEAGSWRVAVKIIGSERREPEWSR